MAFDPLYHPYPSHRVPVYGARGMVATSQPLAAQAGLDILKRGGNAIDAAIATAAALTVLEPCSNGIGGDAFALVWSGGKLHGLNSSGPSPAAISLEAVRALGHDRMPQYGAVPVTVPGAPAAWAELARRFGRLPLAEALRPAVDYAERGYPLSPTAARMWQRAAEHYAAQPDGATFAEWLRTFAPAGRAPRAGELWRSPAHAATLRLIGETDAEAFYRGALAEEIGACIAEHGGFLNAADLAAFAPEWVEPISTNYRGYDVWEIPPNGQGLVALLALGILRGWERHEREGIETVHRQIEAIKLAFADGQHYISDARDMKIKPADLLNPAYSDARRALIGDTAALPEAGRPPAGGTVYLAAADDEGNMVSFIQSNYTGFGSGLVVENTGIALQNRGYGFSLDPFSINRLEPGKRSYHTIIPGFLTREGQAVGPFGVMGGLMQPQGHVQVLMNMLDFQLHPQAALDAPRWQWQGGRTVLVEPGFPAHIAQALARRGHDIQAAADAYSFGRGQIIWRDPGSGVLVGGSDSRTDGLVAAW